LRSGFVRSRIRDRPAEFRAHGPVAGLAGSGCSIGTPSAVMNGGLLNIATEDGQGNLRFWWQDSAGTYHEETVDTSGNL